MRHVYPVCVISSLSQRQERLARACLRVLSPIDEHEFEGRILMNMRVLILCF